MRRLAATWGCSERREAAVMCSDLSCRDSADLTVSVGELAIITIRSVVVSGSCSVQAAPCLTCLWWGKSLLGGRTKCWGLGSLTVSCLPSDICTPLTAMTPMTCSSWPVWSSLLQMEVPVAPWSWVPCLFWEVIWSRTLCLPNPVSWYCYQLFLTRSHYNLLEWRQAKQLSGP